MNNFIADSILGSSENVVKFNVLTNECIFIRTSVAGLNEGKVISIEELEKLFNSAEVYDYKDLEIIMSMIRTGRILERAKNRELGYLTSIHKTENERRYIVHLSMMMPADFSDNNPYIMVYSYKETWERTQAGSVHETIKESFYTIAVINLTTDEIHLIHNSQDESKSFKTMSSKVLYEKMDMWKAEFIYPDDMEMVNWITDMSYLKEHFRQSGKYISAHYRHRIGGIYRWVQAIIKPTVDYSKDHETVLLMVVDTNDEDLKKIDALRQFQYVNFLESQGNKEIYRNFYADMLNLISSFTEPYRAYYTVDLDRDVFKSYKILNVFHQEDPKFIINYSQAIKRDIESRYDGKEAGYLLKQMSIENLREQLTEKNTFSLTFKGSKSEPNNIYYVFHAIRIESRNGVPSRILCMVQEDKSHHDFLKVVTFGSFEVYDKNGQPLRFEKKLSKQVLAYLIDCKGYSVSIRDIVETVLERDYQDDNAKKYASGLVRKAMKNLAEAGYDNVIIEDNHTYRINKNAVDCDYYHLIDGNTFYWEKYNNEYMRDYSWAEATNADITSIYKY